MNLKPVIGLEIHVHLSTDSKLFCDCRNVSEARKPNMYVCPVCMGYPGMLPVLNKKAVEWTILAGLALNCKIAQHSAFARKSYFYPDLPKGYQISQYEEPLCLEGEVGVFSEEGGEKKIGIERTHLEEDAAKNIHDPKSGTLVDYNRAGTPLVEIVTKPDIESPAQAKIFLENLQRTMRYLGVSNADMEHGDLRVDANISMCEERGGLQPKTEIKNLNSFRAVERALNYEIKRQSEMWQEGKAPQSQSTRGWDEGEQRTVEQRTKEEEADYRYFPEPDVPPLTVEDSWVTELKHKLPELPHAKEARFQAQFNLPLEQVRLLVSEKQLADYAENVFSEIAAWNKNRADVRPQDTPRLKKLAANYLLGDFRTVLAEENCEVRDTKITAENFAELIVMLFRSEVNRNAIPKALREMQKTGGDASVIVEKLGLGQVSDEAELKRIVQNIIVNHPVEVNKIRAGKTAVVKFLIGKVMVETKGKANPQKVEEIIKRELEL